MDALDPDSRAGADGLRAPADADGCSEAEGIARTDGGPGTVLSLLLGGLRFVDGVARNDERFSFGV